MRKFATLVIVTLLILGACTKDEEIEGDNKVNNNENNVNETINNEENHKSENDNGNNLVENEEPEEEVSLEAQYKINEVWSIVPIDDRADEKVVLLTIDDAPDKYALEMAKTLKELDAPAIFFVNGHFLETEEEKETLKEIHELGFVIGNHTYGHKNLSEISEEEQREEIVKVNDMVEDIIGERPVFFRAPFGVYSDYSREILAEENMTYMNWSYGYDWEAAYMTKEAIADIMVNTDLLNPGSNLLMHDREWTKEALEDIVNGLRDKGYSFVDPLLIETN